MRCSLALRALHASEVRGTLSALADGWIHYSPIWGLALPNRLLANLHLHQHSAPAGAAVAALLKGTARTAAWCEV